MQTILRVESASFEHGVWIPGECTAHGENVSPPLAGSSEPAGTTMYALLMDAPAGTRGFIDAQ